MKKILITGASSGIGAATAALLHKQGHTLALSARNEAKLQVLADQLGDRVSIHPCDVRDHNQARSSVAAAVEAMGGLDVLLNNAGLGYFDPLADGNLEQWHTMVDTNIKGVLNFLHASLPHLRQGFGHVVNVGSVASHHVFPNSGVYCATKWAVLALSESIRTELASEVKVTTISPGAVNTAFVDQTTNQELLKEYKTYFSKGLPVERIAEAIRMAIETPDDALVSEIIVRPNRARG